MFLSCYIILTQCFHRVLPRTKQKEKRNGLGAIKWVIDTGKSYRLNNTSPQLLKNRGKHKQISAKVSWSSSGQELVFSTSICFGGRGIPDIPKLSWYLFHNKSYRFNNSSSFLHRAVRLWNCRWESPGFNPKGTPVSNFCPAPGLRSIPALLDSSQNYCKSTISFFQSTI